MKKHIWKRITQTGIKLLLSIFALLLVLTGCDFPTITFTPLDGTEEETMQGPYLIPMEKVGTGEKKQYFYSLEELAVFYEEFKKENSYTAIFVDPQKIGATKYFYCFSGDPLILEDGSQSDTKYENPDIMVYFEVEYEGNAYSVVASKIPYKDGTGEDAALDDPTLWSCSSDMRGGWDIQTYFYEWNGIKMMAIGWMSPTTMPNQEFLDSITDAIVVLK